MDIAASRKVAKENGASLYKGSPCPKCGCSVRYAVSGNCRNCNMSAERAAYKSRNYRGRAAKVRDQRLRRTYGITLDQYDGMYAAQNGCCVICGNHKSVLCVDHCHATGNVRGLLCHQCNQAIGLLGEDEENLSRAIAYLRTYNGPQAPCHSTTPQG